MKKQFYGILFALTACLVLALASCTDYKEVTAAPDEWLITVPTTGDTTQQGTLNSFDAYKNNLVSGKTIYIPVKSIAVGKKVNGTDLNKRRPVAKAYLTKRTPITRTYYNETIEGKQVIGDLPGFATETQGSIGVTTGFTFTFHVAEPCKYLYWRSAQTDYFEPVKSADKAELAQFSDTIIYPEAQRIISEFIASVPDDELTSKKPEFYKTLKDQLAAGVGQKYGIEFDSISPKGGFVFDNPDIQKRLDQMLQNQIDAKNAKSELDAQEARAALIPYEKMWVDINMRKALVNYINKAAERGQDIFPKAIGTGTMLDISQYIGDSKK